MKYDVIKDSPVGNLYLMEEQGFLVGISLGQPTVEGFVLGQTEVLQEAKKQLLEYFEGTRKEFQLPLQMKGTEFQKKVWQALLTIPYGETYSYQEIAKRIGNPKAARAVGMANHHNPIMIVVPCHRVIGSSGSLVGYAGGLAIKEQLLRVEGVLL